MIRFLIVEDNVKHAALLRELLQDEYDQVTVYTASSLLEGETIARSILDIQYDSMPTFIIIDQQLPLRGYVGIEGSTLALLLSEDMKVGLIHPAHLVAVSADMTTQRRVLAKQAGCIKQWQKPLGYRQIQDLGPFIDQSPAFTEADDAVSALAHTTINLLRSVMEASQPLRTWSPTGARLLLSTLTPSLYVGQDEAEKRDGILKEFKSDADRLSLIKNAMRNMSQEYALVIEDLLKGKSQTKLRTQLDMGRTRFETFLSLVFRELAIALAK